MRNKIILSFLTMVLSFSIANAASDKVHVAAVEEFDTIKPLQQIDVRVIEPSALGSYLLKSGDIIHCNVIKVTDPKRGKRAASFAVPMQVSFGVAIDNNTPIIPGNSRGPIEAPCVWIWEICNNV